MTLRSKLAFAFASATLAGLTVVAMAKPREESPPTAQPALTVAVTQLEPATLPVLVSANGNIVAWQEAIVGSEANGLRLTGVKVDVGDIVRRGQLLATFAAETVEADVAQARAAVAEAEATLAEAAANAQRAGLLEKTGSLSAQQIQRLRTVEAAARARLDAARAMEKAQQLRLAQTRIIAPDDGIISARTATLGAVVAGGQELFRLIRGGRLEWRAEVTATDLAQLKPGQAAKITLPGGEVVTGHLRTLAPVMDPQTRNGLAYVDLSPNVSARAGMFARGAFELAGREVMTLPQSAVQMREGFSYVMRIGTDEKAALAKVTPGRRAGDRVEIISGLAPEDQVVVAGGAFLGDGDLVRVTTP